MGAAGAQLLKGRGHRAPAAPLAPRKWGKYKLILLNLMGTCSAAMCCHHSWQRAARPAHGLALVPMEAMPALSPHGRRRMAPGHWAEQGEQKGLDPARWRGGKHRVLHSESGPLLHPRVDPCAAAH